MPQFFYHSTSIEFLGQSLVYTVINTNNSLTIDFLVRTDRESKRLKVFKFCHKMDEHKSELGRVFSSVDKNLTNQEWELDTWHWISAMLQQSVKKTPIYLCYNLWIFKTFSVKLLLVINLKELAPQKIYNIHVIW